jgi:hypothetical protein
VWRRSALRKGEADAEEKWPNHRLALIIRGWPFPAIMSGLGPGALSDGVCMVISCYLDDSGTTADSAHLTIAGYIAHPADWALFEKESNDLFAKEGVREPFHGTEFFHRQKQFKGWDFYGQTAFAFDWFGIAAKHVKHGITIALPRKKFSDFKKETGLEPSLSIYGQAFKSLIRKMLERRNLSDVIRVGGISFFVEAGNNNNDEILHWFNRMRAHEDNATYFKSLTFLTKDACYAIQLADYLAFFSRRFANEYTGQGIKEMHQLLDIAKEKVDTIGLLADGFMRKEDWEGG